MAGSTVKIALVSPYDVAVPGGVNAHVAHLAHEFRARGHDVRIIAPGPSGCARDPGTVPLGRAFPFPSGGSFARVTISPWLGPHVKRLLARERFDIIHLHEPLVSSLTLLVLRYSRAVNVGTFHAAREQGSSRGYALSHRFLRSSFKRLDARVAVSPAAARLSNRYFPGCYEIIPNGVDVDRFAAPAACPASVVTRRPYILFVGRFDERKGLPVVLRAYAMLRSRYPDLHLVIVGEGRHRPRYERWVRDHALPGVHFAGRVSAAELSGYYQHAAVYCAPNTGNESFGIVLLEAMAAGCPVVATAIEGFAALLTDGVDGLLVPPRDPAALATALDRVLADPPLVAALTARAAVMVQQYAWPQVAQQVLAVYERLLAARARDVTD